MKCLHYIHREEFISIQKKEIPLYAERGSLVVERKCLRNYLVCFWQGEKKKITHTENVKQEHKVLIVKLLSGQALYQELQWSEHDSLSECRKRLF